MSVKSSKLRLPERTFLKLTTLLVHLEQRKNLLWSSLIMTKELWDALELKAVSFYLLSYACETILLSCPFSLDFILNICSPLQNSTEHEHDVVWFWLEKGKPHECPVCSQYFVLEVVGPGGPPDDHGDEHNHKRPTLLNILVLELMV
ncbi:uncharacterized protein [Primulina eburnea]|uniref:uncharacterized protein n=1 Tax=Primulina eburnea TaxID=1245227 RepID=UPI003C6C9948